MFQVCVDDLGADAGAVAADYSYSSRRLSSEPELQSAVSHVQD